MGSVHGDIVFATKNQFHLNLLLYHKVWQNSISHY